MFEKTKERPSSGLAERFPPIKSRRERPNNLPVQSTSLVGREQEIATACAILRRSDTSLLTLTGPGGTGKTRLSLQIAAELLEDFEQGVYFVALAPISDPALVAFMIAQTLGIKDGGGRSILDGLKNYLRDRQMLLVLDNFEQVVSAAPLLTELLTAAPGLKMLVTSREVLHLYAERELSVPPLGLPDPAKLPDPSQLKHYEAVALFVERARALKSDFELNEGNARAVAEICLALDGLPLAIELAAARIKLLPPEALLARLTGNLGMRLKLLTGGARDLPARQQTLRNAIDWSYGLLSPEEKKLFAKLGVFAGGAAFEAVEVLCADDYPPIDVLNGLASLVDKSLIRQAENHPSGESRFMLLQILREFAQERLTESGGLEIARRRHAEYYLELAERSDEELKGAQQTVWLDRLETEHDNFRAALEWGLENSLVAAGSELAPLEIALRMAGALARFWEMRGHLSEGRERLTVLLQALIDREQLPMPVLAKTLLSIGRLTYLQGDYAAAKPRFEESLELYRQLADKANILVALKCLGDVAMRQSEYNIAKALFEESLALSQELGQKWDSASLLNSLGLLGWFQGDFNSALDYYGRSLILWNELGDKRGYAMVLSNKGAVEHQQGNFAAAEASNRQGNVMWQELGDRWGVGHALQHLGLAAYAQGDFETARRLQEESLELRRKLGDRWGIARALTNLGFVDLYEGKLEAARACFQESLDLRRILEDRWGITDALVGLGAVAHREGNLTASAAYYREGLELAFKYNLRMQVARLLDGLATLLAAQDQLEQAVQFWAAAETLRQAAGAVIAPTDQPEYQRQLSLARNKLGSVRFEAAWETGSQQSLETVIEQATSHKIQAVVQPSEPVTAVPSVPVIPPPVLEKPKGGYPGGLTAREVEVLRLVAMGLTNAQVAEKLIMAPRTVNVHLTSIYSKLDVTSRTAAARFAMDYKLV
jgi:predicted ATPase/DNA-binding CsgD family transcriptional regulator